MTEETSQKIKNMSLLCAAYVVSIHIRLPGDLESSSWFVDQMIVQGFARVAVPFFLASTVRYKHRYIAWCKLGAHFRG